MFKLSCSGYRFLVLFSLLLLAYSVNNSHYRLFVTIDDTAGQMQERKTRPGNYRLPGILQARPFLPFYHLGIVEPVHCCHLHCGNYKPLDQHHQDTWPSFPALPNFWWPSSSINKFKWNEKGRITVKMIALKNNFRENTFGVWRLNEHSGVFVGIVNTQVHWSGRCPDGRPIHLNVRVEFDPGMVGNSFLRGHMMLLFK